MFSKGRETPTKHLEKETIWPFENLKKDFVKKDLTHSGLAKEFDLTER